MVRLSASVRYRLLATGIALVGITVATISAYAGMIAHLYGSALTAMLVLLGLVFLVLGAGILWTLRREKAAHPPPPARRGPNIDRMYRTREFLPEAPPPGWSIPIAPRGRDVWAVDTDAERIIAALEHEGGHWALRVTILRHDSAEPPGDSRCAKILGEFRGVGEFIEGVPIDELPASRTWLAVPRGLRPKWRVPNAPPEPCEPDLSPHLVAARKYLPEKVPRGWSVPVAITDDHGMEWKDGAWMMGAGREVILACLCTSKGRVKLAVTIFRSDGKEVSEATALDLLRQFRGVLEFVQTDSSEEDLKEGDPPRYTYLGELQPVRGQRAMLN